MTEVAEAKPKPQIGKGGSLSAIVPQNLDETFRLAQALSMAGDMVPQHFQGRPEATMAAIVRGMELGLAPMQALSNIAVINGRASLWGDAIPAIVQRHGHHIDVKIEGEGDDAVATATLTRGDTGLEVVRTFSMQDAKKAGLAGKKGPWQQYPKRMLSHRARSWAIRDGAADALMGLQVCEEVEDYEMKDVTPRNSGGAFSKMIEDARAKAQAETTGDSDDEPQAEEPEQEPSADPDSAAYQNGAQAAEGGLDRSDNPYTEDGEQALQWFAGFDAISYPEDEGEDEA